MIRGERSIPMTLFFLELFLIAVTSVMAAEAQAPPSALAHPVSTWAIGSIVASISPDGRFFVFADWGTPGGLAVQDLQSGEYRLIHTGLYSVLFSSVSPDGTQVAYDWRRDDRVYDLRLIGIDGSNSRVLYSNKDTDIYPSDWSPDGKQILALLAGQDGSRQIALISAADGSAQILKTLDSRTPGGMRFSPDGRSIVYHRPTTKDAPGRDLFLLSSDGTHEIPLLLGPADDSVLGWAPDGMHVLFARARDGTMDVWALRVAAGRPEGPPALVRQDIGEIHPLGFSSDGAFYYVRDKGMRNVYLASLDPTTGQLVAPPRRASDRSDDPTFGPAWSPDGERLAYFSTRGNSDFGPGARTIVIRSAGTGEERVLSPKLNFPAGHPYELRWSRDARSLLTIANDDQGLWSFYLVDVQTGDATILVRGRPGERIQWPSWSLDGSVLFFTHDVPATQLSHILARELQSGVVKEIYRAPPLSSVALERGNAVVLSPDGRHLAFSRIGPLAGSQTLMVLPTSGGEARELLSARSIEALDWTPDGRVLVKGNLDDSPESGLWRIPLDGGKPQKVGSAGNNLGMFGASIRPDGREIAYTTGIISMGEVWVMENFLTPSEGTR